ERVGEGGNDALVQQRAEINQHVPATDQVQIREGRINQHVLARKDAQVANALVDLIIPVDLAEKAAQTFGRNVLRYVFGVNAGAGLFDPGITDVSREDLRAAMAA